MKKNKRTCKEDFLLIKRGIREFGKILPGQMGFLIAKSALNALLPYVAAAMSALLLNGLASAQNRSGLFACVLLSVTATLFLSCTVSALEAKIAAGYSRLFSTHALFLTDKSYRIPFFLLENERVQNLRDQISGNIGLTGGGMASLYWDIEAVAGSLCSACAALVFVLRFAAQIAAGVTCGQIGAKAAVLLLLFLAVLTAACAYITCRVASKRFAVSFDVFAHGAEYNRYGEFYDLTYLPDDDMAMDIRIFNQQQLILEESRQKCYSVLAKGKRKEMRAACRLDMAKILCGGICSAAVYVITGFAAIRNVIGIGSVLLVSSAVTMLIAALAQLAQIFTDLRNNNVHLQNYFAYMDLAEETHPKGNRQADPEQCEILFDRVGFCYPESKQAALQDVSLRIAPGEKLAIVGKNGSGKTTLVKLLCRFYRPSTGKILLNGRDIWDYPYEEYISKIATVFQDFFLFAFSIAENVAASQDYDEGRVYAALCKAGLQEKISRLPKGILQAVSHDYEEDGMDLSGGEGQKCAIARAVYKAAPIVILDEPTAALDPYAEQEIHEQFFKNLAGQTMLSISHRLSSCRLCDRIAVLDNGRLVQQGTHEQLLRRPEGLYAELWELQAHLLQVPCKIIPEETI